LWYRRLIDGQCTGCTATGTAAGTQTPERRLMMDSIRKFITRWRPWLIGAGILLVADMYNAKSGSSSASATPVEQGDTETVSAPADVEAVDVAQPNPAATPSPHGSAVDSRQREDSAAL
jgi:hypothetical protein